MPSGYGGVDVEHKIRVGQHIAYNPSVLGNAARSTLFNAGAVYLKGKHLNRLAQLQDQSFIYGNQIYGGTYTRTKNIQYFAGNPNV